MQSKEQLESIVKVLNLLTSGSYGGIEVYCRNIGLNAKYENGFCFLFGEGDVYDQMKKDGLHVYSICEKKKLSKKRISKLMYIARDYDIIVVHHGDPFLIWYYLLLMKKYPKKKYIQTIHSCFNNYRFLNYGFIKRIIRTFEEKRVVKRSDGIVAVSNAVKESYMVFLKNNLNKVHVVYNGIGTDIIKKGRSAKFLLEGKTKLLYIGRLSKEKGVDILLQALSFLSFDYILYIVGDGEERENLETLTEELRLRDKVIFEGFQSDVGKYLSICNIFIYPTLWESFGISIVEAMAYGRICISNAVGGIPEIIKDKENGYLSYQMTVESLSATIEKAVNQINYSGEMRSKAKKTAESFTIERSCDELADLFFCCMKNVRKRKGYT